MSKYCVIETSVNRLSWAMRVAKYRGLIADISENKKTKKQTKKNKQKKNCASLIHCLR